MSRRLCALFCLSYSLAAAAGGLTKFEVRDAVQRDLVTFTSDAPLEKVVGTTSAVTGFLRVNPEQPAAGAQGEFEVDARTFNTGMELRNEHLRSRFLHTSRYPFARFSLKKLTELSKSRLEPGEPVVGKAEGEIEIKGVKRSLSAQIRLTYHPKTVATQERMAGNLLRVSATFSVDLDRFGIFWAPAIALRLSRYIQVTVDALASDVAPSLQIPRPDIPVAEAPPPPENTSSRRLPSGRP